MNEETATWIILFSGERRRMLYVNDRSGQLHRVFDEADEVWRRLDVSQLLEELMLDPERDRLVFVAGAEELRALDHSLDAEKRGLVSLWVDRDLSRIADPLVVHIVQEMLFLSVSPDVAPGARASSHENSLLQSAAR